MPTLSSGSQLLFWLRWSWRDLRARWLQVLAIALVIALGTGSYAGLSSVSRWRRVSTDAAYQSLKMYDLRVALSERVPVPEESLSGSLRQLSDPSVVVASAERLVTEIQVDASRDRRTIIVQGLLYGTEVSKDGPPVNDFYVEKGGRPLGVQDVGMPTALLERNFAKYYDLPSQGTLELSGGISIEYVGQTLTPEYFFVTTEKGGLLAEANFAAVFTSLQSAQALTGREGMVNDLLIRLRPGADSQSVKADIERALASHLPDVGTKVTTREEDPAFHLNDEDIKGDQQTYDIFAALIFAGAVAAAFNLATRMVEAQRREIGNAMVIGLSPAKIAIRPLLVGTEIAVLGVVLGMGVGYVIGQSLISLVKDLQPLPEWRTPFQVEVFAGVATIGVILPILATAWPVWRAVRVTPIEAIRPAYRSGKGGGLAPLFRWLRLPGNTLTQTPFRNIVREPRRSIITSLGIAAALAALVAFVGMIDSFIATTDRGDREILRNLPSRLDVYLKGFLPETSPAVQAIVSAPSIQRAEAGVEVDAQLSNGERQIGLQLEFIDLGSEIWTPTVIAGTKDRTTVGILISERAAKDLNLAPGSSVSLRHPQIQPSGNVRLQETTVVVLGVHPHPFRFVAYMDKNHISLLGAGQVTNRVRLVPAPSSSVDDIKRQLFTLPAVSSIRQVGDIAKAIRDLLNEYVVVLRVIEVAMLLIAVLIAFNSASINVDERAREHSTMFAFGVPVGRVVRMAMVENLLIGMGATAMGLIGGWLLLQLIINERIQSTFPDIYIKPTLATETLLLAALIGVVMVPLAPLLLWNRLRTMDVPSALKVME
ncbi:MAG TPA: FtsX-like permease family protein [Dehalococcoidia bacterium]|nr:FtsX-like permease family protein [Dehalococcoidia bacterium]